MSRASVIALAALLVSAGAAAGAVGLAPASGGAVPAVAADGAVNATANGTERPNATLSRNATGVRPDGTIRFTLTATRGPVTLPDPMPYVVQRRADGRWLTVHTPVAPAVVPPPIERGASRSWTFSPRRLDDPRPGEYRAVFTTHDGDFSERHQLSVRFRVVGGAVLALRPGETGIGTNGTVALDVVVRNATRGVGAYDLRLEVSRRGPAVPELGPPVEVVSVRDRAGAASVAARIGPDNQSASLSAAGVNITGSPRTLATVTLVGVARGRAVVTLERPNVTDGDGSRYVIPTAGNASVTVAPGPPPIAPGLGPPTDPDSDGDYEDANGDGSFTVVDVSALLGRLDEGTVRANARFFAFDTDGPRGVDVLDVAALLEEL